MRTASLLCRFAVLAVVGLTGLSAGNPAFCQEHLTVHGMTQDALEDHLNFELGERQFGTLPRWHQQVCVDIHGVQEQFDKMLFSHLKNTGSSLGLSLSRDCSAKQLFVFFTDQSDALAAGIHKLNPDLFVGLDNAQEYQESKVEATRDEVRQFLKPRAVRWLASSSMRNKSDMPPIILPSGFPVKYAAPVVDSALGNVTTRRDLTIVLIIIDINRLRNESWGMLGDLLSLVAFAAPHLRDGYDDRSLLRYTQTEILEGPTGEMLPYDRAVLATLYALPDDYDQSDGLNWMASHFSPEARSH